MSDSNKEGYYQSSEYYWLIFTGKFCVPKNEKLINVWKFISKENFNILFKNESWNNPEEMLSYFYSLADRLDNLKSFK